MTARGHPQGISKRRTTRPHSTQSSIERYRQETREYSVTLSRSFLLYQLLEALLENAMVLTDPLIAETSLLFEDSPDMHADSKVRPLPGPIFANRSNAVSGCICPTEIARNQDSSAYPLRAEDLARIRQECRQSDSFPPNPFMKLLDGSTSEPFAIREESSPSHWRCADTSNQRPRADSRDLSEGVMTERLARKESSTIKGRNDSFLRPNIYKKKNDLAQTRTGKLEFQSGSSGGMALEECDKDQQMLGFFDETSRFPASSGGILKNGSSSEMLCGGDSRRVMKSVTKSSVAANNAETVEVTSNGRVPNSATLPGQCWEKKKALKNETESCGGSYHNNPGANNSLSLPECPLKTAKKEVKIKNIWKKEPESYETSKADDKAEGYNPTSSGGNQLSGSNSAHGRNAILGRANGNDDRIASSCSAFDALDKLGKKHGPSPSESRTPINPASRDWVLPNCPERELVTWPDQDSNGADTDAREYVRYLLLSTVKTVHKEMEDERAHARIRTD